MSGRENSKEMENFLSNIVWIRKKQGISKKNMAKILKISVSSFNKIENGICPPKLSANVVWRIYLNFGICPDEQFCRRLEDE